MNILEIYDVENEVENTRPLELNPKFLHETILKAIIEDDEKKFDYLMKRYKSQVDIFLPIASYLLEESYGDNAMGLYYSKGDENYNEETLIETALSDVNDYYIDKILNLLDIDKEISCYLEGVIKNKEKFSILNGIVENDVFFKRFLKVNKNEDLNVKLVALNVMNKIMPIYDGRMLINKNEKYINMLNKLSKEDDFLKIINNLCRKGIENGLVSRLQTLGNGFIRYETSEENDCTEQILNIIGGLDEELMMDLIKGMHNSMYNSFSIKSIEREIERVKVIQRKAGKENPDDIDMLDVAICSVSRIPDILLDKFTDKILNNKAVKEEAKKDIAINLICFKYFLGKDYEVNKVNEYAISKKMEFFNWLNDNDNDLVKKRKRKL